MEGHHQEEAAGQEDQRREEGVAVELEVECRRREEVVVGVAEGEEVAGLKLVLVVLRTAQIQTQWLDTLRHFESAHRECTCTCRSALSSDS